MAGESKYFSAALKVWIAARPSAELNRALDWSDRAGALIDPRMPGDKKAAWRYFRGSDPALVLGGQV